MNRYWQTALEADGRLRAAGVDYCLIKSYGGNLEFEDANLDLVVSAPLWEVRGLFGDFAVTGRDAAKNRLYELNKLMLKDRSGRRALLHLHSNAGWHNVCFVAGQTILRQTRELALEGGGVRVTRRDLEGRLYVLHVVFEQFQKNAWDVEFLTPKDFDDFAGEFGLPGGPMAAVRDAPVGPLPWRALRPIWRAYYARSPYPVHAWNRFLHWGLTCLQAHRRRRADTRRATTCLK